MREIPHLFRNNGKSAARLSCTRRFDGGVERQQIGLHGNFVDSLDNFSGLVRGFLDFIDGQGHIRHCFGTLCGIGFRLTGKIFGLEGVLGVLFGH